MKKILLPILSKLLNLILSISALVLSCTLVAQAQTVTQPINIAVADAPDEFVRRISNDILNQLKSDAAIKSGDIAKITALVDAKVLPYVNLQRMTAQTMGRFWRTATPEQKQRMQEEFKTLLMRTYAGAFSQVKDQTLYVKPMRNNPDDTEVLVRTEIRGKGEPIQLDYRLEKESGSWKVYDFNVMGVWMAEQYRTSFSQEINAIGIDGLIYKLAEKNKVNRK
jgi:phospholipid transport system substrate-binding protein